MSSIVDLIGSIVSLQDEFYDQIMRSHGAKPLVNKSLHSSLSLSTNLNIYASTNSTEK